MVGFAGGFIRDQPRWSGNRLCLLPVAYGNERLYNELRTTLLAGRIEELQQL